MYYIPFKIYVSLENVLFRKLESIHFTEHIYLYIFLANL